MCVCMCVCVCVSVGGPEHFGPYTVFSVLWNSSYPFCLARTGFPPLSCSARKVV